MSTIVVKALVSLKGRSKFNGPDDLIFASRKGTPLNENNLLRNGAFRPAGTDGTWGCSDDDALHAFGPGTKEGGG